MRDEGGDVVGRQAEARPDLAEQRHPGRRVVARVALADVVEEGAEHEQVGPRHAVGELGRVGRGLPQVPVDGEAVVRVALRPAADRLPLGEQAHEDAALVERLQHVDRAVALLEQQHELRQRARRPAVHATPRRRPRPPGDRAWRATAARRAGRRRGRPAARSPDRRAMSARDDSSISRSTTTSPSPTRSSWPIWWREMCRHAPSAIQPIVRAAAATSAIRPSAESAPTAARHGVLVLQPQHVAGPAGDAVQGDADVDELAVARVEQGEVVGRHEEVGIRRPPQRLHVAQPAVAVLEVGLEQEGHVAGLGAALDAPSSAGRRANAARCAATGRAPRWPGGRPAPRRPRGTAR